MSEACKVAVVFATKGRPETVGRALLALRQQTRPADTIVVSATSSDDVPSDPAVMTGVKLVCGSAGLPAQRNRGLAVVRDYDVIIFFDDDFYPSRTWIDHVCRIFSVQPDLGAVTGRVLRDGILGAGLSWEEAARDVAAHDAGPAVGSFDVRRPYSPYGCNMAFRGTALDGRAFDERLVLYGWQEDRDMGGQVERAGWATGYADALVGVHLGVKSARSPGKRLGYSQVVNVAYLMRKGTMPLSAGFAQMGRNLLANVRGWMLGDPDVDRAGRLQGNLIGIFDIALGKLRPERAAEFDR